MTRLDELAREQPHFGLQALATALDRFLATTDELPMFDRSQTDQQCRHDLRCVTL